MVHDSADPGTGDRRAGEIDVFSDQALRPFAPRIDHSLAGAGVPVEQNVDAVSRYFYLSPTLLPFIRGIACYRGIDAAVPATRPIAFDGFVLAGFCLAPTRCVHIIRG